MILQIKEATEVLSKSSDQPIILGMFAAVFLMACIYILIHKYGPSRKIELTGPQAIDITNEMLNKVDVDKIRPQKIDLTVLDAMEITQTMTQKILDEVTVDGHTVGKRISKMHHDVSQAIKNKDDISTILLTISEGQDNFNTIVHDNFKEQADRDEKHHLDRMELQEKYLQELVKNKSNGRNGK